MDQFAGSRALVWVADQQHKPGEPLTALPGFAVELQADALVVHACRQVTLCNDAKVFSKIGLIGLPV